MYIYWMLFFLLFSLPSKAVVSGSTISYEDQPTRLRITNECSFTIWIQCSKNVSEKGNPLVVKLEPNQSHDYNIPDEGLDATRFWAKIGCDEHGNNCKMGQSEDPCPEGGCQPPIESKFEATWASTSCPHKNPGASCLTWYNISFVDGYMLPVICIPKGPDIGKNRCLPIDASKLDLNKCPAHEDLSGGKPELAKFKNVDLCIKDDKGNKIGCMSPCKKLNVPPPWGFGLDEKKEPTVHMCCPTDPVLLKKGECTWARGCATSEACRNKKDPLSVENTKYVEELGKMAHNSYSYAYQDKEALMLCTAQTKFEVIYGPEVKPLKPSIPDDPFLLQNALHTLQQSLNQLNYLLRSK